MKEFSNQYLEHLNEHFSGLNLTRILEEEEFHNKQTLDSIIPAQDFLPLSGHLKKVKFCIDIGFGGGFPILPLAKLFPETRFLGFEARRKKSDAVNELARLMNLKNVKTHHARVESLNFDCDCIVTFKAVGKISELLEKIKGRGVKAIYFYKGPGVEKLEEVNPFPKKFELFDRFDYVLPGGDIRQVLAYRPIFKDKNPIKNNNLVKVSHLI